MKYAMCPNCGRRLCKGDAGTKVEIECPKCGEWAVVTIGDDDLHICKKAPPMDKPIKQHA